MSAPAYACNVIVSYCRPLIQPAVRPTVVLSRGTGAEVKERNVLPRGHQPLAIRG